MGNTQHDNKVGATVIAKIYGVTVKQIDNLRRDGVIKCEGRPARYDLIPTLQALYEYQRRIIKSNGKSDENRRNEAIKLDAEARLKQAKAEMAELELQELQGEMHRAEDVEAITTNIVFAVRSFLLAMPNRLAIDVYNAKSKTQVSEVIKKEIYQILEQLANLDYDKADYKKLVRERKGLREDEDDL